MRERPIIMTGPEVRAILAGAKTQTRRLVTPQPKGRLNQWDYASEPGDAYMDGQVPVVCVESRGRNKRDAGELTLRPLPCPYGVPGDRLWVRETFRPVRFPGKPVVGIHYVATENPHTDALIALKAGQRYLFPDDVGPDPQWPEGVACKTRPSTFLPRWASRLTLEVTEVRVQRLNELTDADAVAEGITHESGTPPTVTFARLWDSFNGRRCPWQSDPWVWVLAFRRV